VYGSTGIAAAFTASLHTRSAGRYASGSSASSPSPPLLKVMIVFGIHEHGFEKIYFFTEKKLLQTENHGWGERGVAGSDPITRGRSPVVLEVRFRSRAFSIAEIQSEIVLGYLHYLDFCAV